jgi:hypothetical protein
MISVVVSIPKMQLLCTMKCHGVKHFCYESIYKIQLTVLKICHILSVF